MPESVWDWSRTAADNNDADSAINWSEGQAPGSVNNSARAMMAALANFRDDTGGALATAGGTTAYTLTTSQGLAALVDGVRIHAVVNATNTGAATLNVDSLGAKAVRIVTGSGDTALIGGELPAGYHAVFQYDASAASAAGAWILLNPPAFNPARGPDVILEDQKSSGTAGGGFTSGADRTRELNNEVRDARGECTLSSNQFTLPAGTWFIAWSAPAYRVGANQSLLYSVTDTAEIARGTSNVSVTGSGDPTRSEGSAVVTIAGSKAFEVRHRCSSTQATNGFGDAANFGTEVYTRVEITRIA